MSPSSRLNKLPPDARHHGPNTAFAEAFEAAWAQPTADALTALLHDEVVLYQPTAPPIHGCAAAHREFTALLRWLPGTHAVVDESLGEDAQCYIRFRLCFPIGRKGVHLPSVDHFILRDGRALSRRAHFDPAPLMLAVALRPWMWWGFFRYRLGIG